MNILSEIVAVIFIAIVFYGVISGFAIVTVISFVGFLKGFVEQKPGEVAIFLSILLFLGSGLSLVRTRISTDSVQAEVIMLEKEQFVHEWIFKDEVIATEEIDRALHRGITRFHVIREEDMEIFVVDVYDDKAFDLFKYTVEPFNKDDR